MRKMSIFWKKGQTTAEYAVLIGLVIAAAMAMQIYVRRGIQGRVHGASDLYFDKVTQDAGWANISTAVGVAAEVSKQYEPDKLYRQSTQKTNIDDERTQLKTGGTVTRDYTRETEQEAGDYQKWDYVKQ